MTIALPQAPVTHASAAGDELLTHTRRSAMQKCARLHYLRYEAGVVRDVEEKPLRFGGAFHVGLDERNKGASHDDAISLGVAGYEVQPAWANTAEKLDEWEHERETVARLLAGYWWRWGDVDAQLETVASEFEFRIPIRNPQTGAATQRFVLAGKIDRIVKLPDGRLAVWETKTTGSDISTDSVYWRRLRIDSQVSSYYHAARANGYDVQTVIYDVARKPSIERRQVPLLDSDGLKVVLDGAGNRVMLKNGKPRQSGSKDDGYVLQSRLETVQEFGERFTSDIVARPDFYFSRRELPRLQADIREFEQDLWDDQKVLADRQRFNRWPRSSGSCLAPFQCPYLDVCHLKIDADNIPTGFKRLANLHPELDEQE